MDQSFLLYSFFNKIKISYLDILTRSGIEKCPGYYPCQFSVPD